jgi:hypothetical protein
MSETDALILAGTGCVCAFFVLVLVGGVGFFLMQKKKKADAADAPSAAEPSAPATPALSNDTPELEPAATQVPVPDPTITSSTESNTPSEPDPSEILEPDDSGAADEPEDAPGPLTSSEPVEVPDLEPTQTPFIPDTPGEPLVAANTEEPVPDPSGIEGLDAPIIAADTLDEDEAESPTVIIRRDPKDGEDA